MNTKTHPHAALAIYAAHRMTQWGDYAALRYALNRGCPMRLVKLAMALERDVDEVLWN